MTKWDQLFRGKKPVIAMIHVQALPGTPGNRFSINEIVEFAVKEADIFQKYRVDAIMLENMHDIPYLNRKIGPEIVACMTRVAVAVKQTVSVPLGIQILAAANKEALAVAQAANLEFVRVEGFVFGHVADEGYIDSCAGELLRYRRHLNAEHIAILTDIKKKHSAHSITSDVTLAETAKAAEFFLSDGLIVTGASTGMEADLNEIVEVKEKSHLPVIVGSGITRENFRNYKDYADGFIIGSFFKENGLWSNAVSEKKVEKFMNEVECNN
ncbi:MAG: BtpA/SgcQ family protein [Candidatus Cloacimonetes bacterium]|nr:BtpA/SgcQ family protein [Candidatus Cloacimonadota bacterium]